MTSIKHPPNRYKHLDSLNVMDQDSSISDEWKSDTLPPLIFIMGLHRSGTTFLYESLSKILPVSKVTIQYVIFYPQMVDSHKKDHGKHDKERLEGYFNSNGLSVRGNDNIDLSADTAEEYGWILRKEAGSFTVCPATLETLKNLAQKLNFIAPEKRAVLLKNPWDISHADFIAESFPTAKFIFIRRNPLEILSSEVRNAQHFGKGNDPLLNLLINRIPEKKALFVLIRLLKKTLRKRVFSKLMTRLLFSDIITNLHYYDNALKKLPTERTLEISYKELVNETQSVLAAIALFLEMPAIVDLKEITGERRSGGLISCVADKERDLIMRLKEENLAHFLDT